MMFLREKCIRLNRGPTIPPRGEPGTLPNPTASESSLECVQCAVWMMHQIRSIEYWEDLSWRDRPRGEYRHRYRSEGLLRQRPLALLLVGTHRESGLIDTGTHNRILNAILKQKAHEPGHVRRDEGRFNVITGLDVLAEFQENLFRVKPKQEVSDDVLQEHRSDVESPEHIFHAKSKQKVGDDVLQEHGSDVESSEHSHLEIDEQLHNLKHVPVDNRPSAADESAYNLPCTARGRIRSELPPFPSHSPRSRIYVHRASKDTGEDRDTCLDGRGNGRTVPPLDRAC